MDTKEELASRFALTKAEEWDYIAEGALNVALKYCGKDDGLKGFVLRLRKNNPKVSGGKRMLDPWDETTEFTEKMILPLLGRRFVHPTTKVQVGPKFIAAVNSNITESRPMARRKHLVDDKVFFGLLMVDSTSIPGGNSPIVCFEIKTKCGFIPTSEWVTKAVKKKYSRYHMHQFLKLSQGKIQSISNYSPPDLFSKDPERVSHALRCLQESPQNNFRMFIDGQLVFPDKDGHGNRLSLLKIFEDAKVQNPNISDRILDILGKILVHEPLLDNILMLQKFDEADIEAVWPIYQEILRRGENITPLWRGDTMYPRPPISKLPENPSDQHELVRRFLLACTAKDCSVMIAMHPDCKNEDYGQNKNNDQVSVNKSNTKADVNGFHGYSYSAAVVDLDPKPLTKMQRYYELDAEIADYFSKHIQSGQCSSNTNK